MPLIKTENEVIAAQKILNIQQQERKYSHINSSNECEWKNFWERIVKCIKSTLEESNLLWANIGKRKIITYQNQNINGEVCNNHQSLPTKQSYKTTSNQPNKKHTTQHKRNEQF